MTTGRNSRFYALAAGLLIAAPSAFSACSAKDIEIKSFKARFVDECRRRACPHMKGVAVLVNHCASATGVQVKIIGYDKNKQPVAARELWPASIRNIAPGPYTFSLDTWLDYDPDIRTFTLSVAGVTHWQ